MALGNLPSKLDQKQELHSFHYVLLTWPEIKGVNLLILIYNKVMQGNASRWIVRKPTDLIYLLPQKNAIFLLYNIKVVYYLRDLRFAFLKTPQLSVTHIRKSVAVTRYEGICFFFPIPYIFSPPLSFLRNMNNLVGKRNSCMMMLLKCFEPAICNAWFKTRLQRLAWQFHPLSQGSKVQLFSW